MRSGLLAFGVLLFIVGAALYFIPGAATADATRMGARPLYSVSALANIGLLTMVLGAILAILGLIVPAAKPDVHKHHDHRHGDGHVHKRVESSTTRNRRGRVTRRREVKEYD